MNHIRDLQVASRSAELHITPYSRIASLRLLGPPEVFPGSNPGGQPCEPNRIAAAPLGLKVLGFVNTRDVS
jgi:hypothetical protein